VVRSLIGEALSDGGADPPFGTQKPLAIVGLNADGLVSATTIFLPTANWPTLKVSALTDIGTDLASAQVTGTDLRYIMEDMGRGLAFRPWVVTGTTPTGAVLIFFSGETGKVAAVIAVSETTFGTAAGGEPAAHSEGNRVVLRGRFSAAYTAKDPARNLVRGGKAQQVILNARTGQVASVN
jgi:hypothetical protein